MAYDIVFAPEAIAAYAALDAATRAEVRDHLDTHLRHEPTKVSKSRIKRLRGLRQPQFRLRVGDKLRVFYDVTATEVHVLVILSKAEVEAWLGAQGVPE